MTEVVSKPIRLFTTKQSPFGIRVEITLREKGIEFLREEVNLKEKPQLLVDINPNYKKVPVIIHNGKAIAESLIILEYLEDAFPEVPLFPTDPFEKSNVRFWTDYICKGFQSMEQAMMTRPGSLERIAAVNNSLECLTTVNETMTTMSADGPFFSGKTISILDVALAPLVTAVTSLETLGGVTLPRFDECPRLHMWIGFMQTRPSFTAALPSSQVLFKYLQNVARSVQAPPSAGRESPSSPDQRNWF